MEVSEKLMKEHGTLIACIYGVMISQCNNTYTIIIKRKELATMCKVSERSIVNAINAMVSLNLIVRLESFGKENTYKVIPLEGDQAQTHPEQPVKEPKQKYGEYQHVELTEKQYASLIKRYNENTVNGAIKAMDEYCEKHGKKYANCYLKLIEWIDQDNDKKLYYGKRRRGKKSYVKGGIRDQEMANLDQYLDCVNLYTVDATNKEDDE